MKVRAIQRPTRLGIAFGFVSLAALACSALTGELPNVPKIPGSCPVDVSDGKSIASAKFDVETAIASKAKAALGAGADLQEISADIEADVAAACAKLATDLGVPQAELEAKSEKAGAKAEAACRAAAKAVTEMKSELSAKLVVTVQPPKCHASTEALQECVASCTSGIQPASVEVECVGGELSGKCSGSCQGSCTLPASARCEGSCLGTCEGGCSVKFSGSCGGTCMGKCNGATSRGSCSGLCEGACSSEASGTCGGTCNGACSAGCVQQAAAECSGSCSGSCSAGIESPSCSGTLKPPQLAPECRAKCAAAVQATLRCDPPRVAVSFAGKVAGQPALKLASALQEHLPPLLQISIGMKDQLDSLGEAVQASLDGAREAVTTSGDAALELGSCFAKSLDVQAAAMTRIDAALSASFQASAAAGAS